MATGKSSRKPKVYTARNTYTDRAKAEKDTFSELPVNLLTMESALLLLDSIEENVLITILKHITEFIRKQEENIIEIKEKNLFELLLQRDIYMTNDSVLVRRFALYIFTAIIESINVLQDLETPKTIEVMDTCLRYFHGEEDDFCLEYLAVIMNKCANDPHVALYIKTDIEYLQKMFVLLANSDNPDILLNTFEILHKILQVQDTESMQAIAADPYFPIERIICELTNEYPEIRRAALKVIKILIADTSELSPLAVEIRAVSVMEQLTKVFCENSMEEDDSEVIEVLSIAMRNEKLAQIFFEQNLFDKIVQNLEKKTEIYSAETKCRIMSIFAEAARYIQYLYRLYTSHIVEMFLDCYLTQTPATYIVTGLIRMLKFPEAANKIIKSYSDGLITKTVKILHTKDVNIKTREQTAEFLIQLLLLSFHNTVAELLRLGFPDILGDIFGQSMDDLSIDYILLLLNIIESLAQNNEYRARLAESLYLTRNIALMLKNSFATAILVNNIFRCLCTLVDEENVRAGLLHYYIIPSVKRGLKCLANLVRSSVTNFIMQTTRFPEFLDEYVNNGVLEVLILYQKHSFCISTWNPAIESILSKCPTLKFCIRNHLGFTDITAGKDFLVSKLKFEDFRVFQQLLKEEVSPLHPILVINFERPKNPSELVITVPMECFNENELMEMEEEPWRFCLHPGDAHLPEILDDLNDELARNGLIENPPKIKRCIDFDNLAKRAKIIANIVAFELGNDLKILDINSPEECSKHAVKCHMKELSKSLHCTFIPLGMVRSGCQFERAIMFKVLADQIGFPCTLQRSVDGNILFNEVPLPLENEYDIHCDKDTKKFVPWRLLRPTHIVDLLYNVGELYPIQSRQAIQYLRLYP